MKEYDLELVMISQRVYHSWEAHLLTTITSLRMKYPTLRIEEIPDEAFRVYDGGKAEIFVKVRGTEISMAVPSDEWKWMTN